jgi:hypothetical protein
MDTPYTLLFFGGPSIAALAFVACLIPRIRPQRLPRTLAALGLITSLPVVVGILMNSGYPLLILRPGTIFLGLLAGISYFVLSRKLHLPFRQCIAAVALLLASVWDGVSLTYIMTPGFGGAYCLTSPDTNKANKTVVATADNVPHSLRSGRPSPAAPHL